MLGAITGINYIYGSLTPMITVKCSYCKKSRNYFSGEMVYEYKQKKFCSHTCRVKYIKEKVWKTAKI